MIFFLNLISFFLFYFLCLSIFFFINYYIVKIKKFFIITICGYDFWTFFDDPFRFNINNTMYHNDYDYYILDYEYFEILEDICYNDVFLDPNLEFIFYIDYIAETRTAEDDEHELYRFLSNYVIPTHYKYYVIEHYWPPDERGSLFLYENFYDFFDLVYEFKFINEEFFPLWNIYEKEIHTRTIFVNENLHDNKLIKFYYFNKQNKFFQYKTEILNDEYYRFSKNIFIRKEIRSFDKIEPKAELEYTDYVKWRFLSHNYNLDKFDYDIFESLPFYELFDRKYYDLYLDFYKNLIDVKTTYIQFIETSDEYFNDFINKDNLLNYYFEIGLQHEYINFALNVTENNVFDQTFNYFYVRFKSRFFLLYFYMLYIHMFFFFLLLLLGCWFTYHYFDYAFNFDLHLSYIRSLTRMKYLNDYKDYKDLIFNQYYYSNDIHVILFNKNKDLLFASLCDRDRLKFPDKFSF